MSWALYQYTSGVGRIKETEHMLLKLLMNASWLNLRIWDLDQGFGRRGTIVHAAG